MGMTMKERIEAKRAAIAANSSKGIRPYKFKNGDTLLRILPVKGSVDEFERSFGKTYLKSFDGTKFFGIGDRTVTYDEPDFVRDLIFDAMRAAQNEDVRTHYKSMLANRRRIFNALVLNDPSVKATDPQIIEVSENQMDAIYSQMQVWLESKGPDYEVLNHVLKVEKTGSGLDTKYMFTVTPTEAPVAPEILDRVHDLDTWIAGQFEGLEAGAADFLLKLAYSAGINFNANLLPAQLSSGQAASLLPVAQGSASSTNPSNMSSAAVTQILDDEVPHMDKVVDAVVEDIADDKPPFPADDAAPAPAAAAPAAAAPAGNEDIDAILAQLNG